VPSQGVDVRWIVLDLTVGYDSSVNDTAVPNNEADAELRREMIGGLYASRSLLVPCLLPPPPHHKKFKL